MIELILIFIFYDKNKINYIKNNIQKIKIFE